MVHGQVRSEGPQLKLGWLVVIAIFSACNRVPEPPPPVQSAPLVAEKPAAPGPAAPTPPAYTTAAEPTFDADHPWLGPGWSKLSLQDTLPICAFSSNAERNSALLIQQVKKQTFTADSTVVFGAYGPGCLNKECDARPNLQCWLELEGDTIHVHTKYFSFHKDGSSCTKDCLEVDASCETPVLKAGKYTIKHGDKTYGLQIPSVVKKPCFTSK